MPKLLDKIFKSAEKYKPFLNRKFKTHYIDRLPNSKKINLLKKKLK